MNLFLKNTIKLLLPILLFFLIISCYNIYLDPYGVINGNMEAQKIIPNQRYLKTKFILKNKNLFNCFLFGSSKAGKIDVSKLNDNKSWYNFQYSEALPQEILTDLKLLINKNVVIDKIIIGLEGDSYLVDPEIHMTQPLRKGYKNFLFPLIEYILLKPSLKIYREIKLSETKKYFEKGLYNSIYNKGFFKKNKKDLFIEENPQKHLESLVFNECLLPSYYEPRISKTIITIRSIIKFCKINHIEIVFFVHPMYYKRYEKLLALDFLRFLKALSKETSFYDFSGYNSWTINTLNYYECSHYRPKIGDSIICALSSKKTPVINNNNIDSLINKKKIERIGF